MFLTHPQSLAKPSQTSGAWSSLVGADEQQNQP